MANVQNELDQLRSIVSNEIYSLETWATLYDVCQSLGLAKVENPALGKARYLLLVTKETDDQSIISAAKKMINSYPGLSGQPNSIALQKIQDSIWWIECQGIKKFPM